MEEAIKKSDVLIEALPYIRQFHGKIAVVKFGGNVILNADRFGDILQDIVFMHYVGMNPVLVHGGGPLINQKMQDRGLKPQFVDGHRVTDARAMEVVQETLEEINQTLQALIKKLGTQVIGFTGAAGELIKVEPHRSAKLGRVGDIVEINRRRLKTVLKAGKIPVVSSLGADEQKKVFNVNADNAAAEIAKSLAAEKLVLMTDVQGIFSDAQNEDSLLPTLTVEQAEDLITRKIILKGMIPKVRACISALKSGVRKTHIIGANIPHALLLEIFTTKGIGTEIVK